MSFIWPPALLLLALIPLGVLADRALERRRRRALQASGLGRVVPGGSADARSHGPGSAAGGGRSARVQRRVPGTILLLGLVLMTLALARPQGVVSLPRNEGTVILAFDVSGSMAATDLAPTRIQAARAAARAFVERQPAGVIIGIVAFSDGGIAVQAPTRDQAAVLGAIDRLEPQRGTSLGQGILVALHTIEITLHPPPTDFYSNRAPRPGPTPAPTPVPAGTYAPAVVVLLSDGENNEEPDPLEAAHAAADLGVRIHTIGIGSPGGADLDLDGFTVHTQLNEQLLRDIAGATSGTYYHVQDAAELQQVYETVDTRLLVKEEALEVTALFAAVSVLLLVAGGILSLRWLGRLP